MAAIDFPASPTVGQVFIAGNGVVYQWNGTLWLATGMTTSAGGDFCANQTSGFPSFGATVTTLVLTQVISGNSGGWYSTSTGRYTPPAGRYVIYASYSAGSTAGPANLYLKLRKNGVEIHNDVDSTPGVNNHNNPSFCLTLDANGTDYFDIAGYAGGNTANAFIGLTFGAFPISGIKGPPGDYPSGALYMHSEQVLASPASQIVVTVPANCKRIDLQWAVRNVSDAGGSFMIQSMESGTANGGAVYNRIQILNPTATTVSAATEVNQNGFGGFGVSYCAGTARLTLFSPLNQLVGELACWAQNTGAANRYNISQSLQGANAALCTGFRLVNSGSSPNFDTGSVLRAYVAV